MGKTIAEQFQQDWESNIPEHGCIIIAIDRLESRLSALEGAKLTLKEAHELAQKTSKDIELRRDKEREDAALEGKGKREWIDTSQGCWGCDKFGHIVLISLTEGYTPYSHIMPYIPGEPKPEPPEVK
jgi:hypothetical protein